MVRPETRSRLLVGLILFCGGLAFIAFFFTGEEGRIQKQIENLRETVSKKNSKTEPAAGSRAKRIGRLFAAPCRIEAAVYDISKTFTPDEIGPSIMAVRALYSRIGIDIYDLHIMDIMENRAVVKCTVSIDLLPHTGSSMTDIHEIECRLKKDRGRWFFSEIRTVDVLER